VSPTLRASRRVGLAHRVLLTVAGPGGRVSTFTPIPAPARDAKTSALVARRVARAETLLAKATRTSKRAARAAALRKVARRVTAVLRRLGRSSAVVSVPCGETLARFVTDVRSLALALVP
jgi:hypothetical protein